jgi:hypothetical protein
VANWYVGVYEGAYTPVATDTMATFPADSTECTTYAGATRPALTLGAIAGGAVDNFAATTDFAFNATKTVYGGFIVIVGQRVARPAICCRPFERHRQSCWTTRQPSR